MKYDQNLVEFEHFKEIVLGTSNTYQVPSSDLELDCEYRYVRLKKNSVLQFSGPRAEKNIPHFTVDFPQKQWFVILR